MNIRNVLKGKRKFVVIIAVIVAVMVPFTVFAATSDTTAAKSIRGFFGIDPANFNDQQKADVTEYMNKMAQLQKEFIDKMVANGALTKEQGDAAIKAIDENTGIFGPVRPGIRQDMKSGIRQGMRPGMPSGKGSLNKPACGDCDGSCVTE